MIVLTMFAPCSPHTHEVRTTAADGPSDSASRSPISFERPYADCGFGSSHSTYGRSSVPSNT